MSHQRLPIPPVNIRLLLEGVFWKSFLSKIPHLILDHAGLVLSSHQENLLSECPEIELNSKTIFFPYRLKTLPLFASYLKEHLLFELQNSSLGQRVFLDEQQALCLHQDFESFLWQSQLSRSWEEQLAFLCQRLCASIPFKKIYLYILKSQQQNTFECVYAAEVLQLNLDCSFVQKDNSYNFTDNCIEGVVAYTRQAYFCAEPYTDVLFQKNIYGTKPKTFLCLPLLHHQDLIGLLCLTDYSHPTILQDDLFPLDLYTTSLSHLLQNLLYFKDLQHENASFTDLGHFVSKNLAQKIYQFGPADPHQFQKRHLVSLYADIRSFTKISENLDPQDLLDILNLYFKEMNKIITEHEGTIIQLVGDMIIAIWNAPDYILDAELKATRAALQMQLKWQQKIYPQWVLRGVVDAVGVGIGISAGEAIVGDLGASGHWQYSAMGEAVEDAHLLESQAAGGEVIVTENIHQLIQNRIPLQALVRPNESLRANNYSATMYIYQPLKK